MNHKLGSREIKFLSSGLLCCGPFRDTERCHQEALGVPTAANTSLGPCIGAEDEQPCQQYCSALLLLTDSASDVRMKPLRLCEQTYFNNIMTVPMFLLSVSSLPFLRSSEPLSLFVCSSASRADG